MWDNWTFGLPLLSSLYSDSGLSQKFYLSGVHPVALCTRIFFRHIPAIATENLLMLFFSLFTKISAPSGHPQVKHNLLLIYIGRYSSLADSDHGVFFYISRKLSILQRIRCSQFVSLSRDIHISNKLCFTWGWPEGAEIFVNKEKNNINKFSVAIAGICLKNIRYLRNT
jgi:hypothetical protein